MNCYLVILWEENRIPMAYNMISYENVNQVKAQMNINENYQSIDNNEHYFSYEISNEILSKYFDDTEENTQKKIIFHIFDGSSTIHEIICALEYYTEINEEENILR